MIIIAKFLSVALIGYLLGSIPFGLLITQRSVKVDIREYGSGKTGTTNVLRVAGKKAAAISVFCDLLKGVLPVLLAGLIVGKSYWVVGNFALGLPLAQVLGALAAMAGHNWSLFLGFHGGRGVATFFGGLIALSPVVALFGGEILVTSAVLTGYMSLSSLAGVTAIYSVLLPLTIVSGFPIEYLVYAFIGAVTVIIMHRDNIVRLVAGKERKLGEKAEKIS